MENVDTKIEGNIMTIKVDLTKSFGPSKSGKTTIIASTHGAVKIGEVTVNLNIYKGR